MPANKLKLKELPVGTDFEALLKQAREEILKTENTILSSIDKFNEMDESKFDPSSRAETIISTIEQFRKQGFVSLMNLLYPEIPDDNFNY